MLGEDSRKDHIFRGIKMMHLLLLSRNTLGLKAIVRHSLLRVVALLPMGREHCLQLAVFC